MACLQFSDEPLQLKEKFKCVIAAWLCFDDNRCDLQVRMMEGLTRLKMIRVRRYQPYHDQSP